MYEHVRNDRRAETIGGFALIAATLAALCLGLVV
jgi:hypothetical protein